MGMTDKQYKGMLLEDLENWKEMLELVRESGNEKAVRKAQQQIDKINHPAIDNSKLSEMMREYYDRAVV